MNRNYLAILVVALVMGLGVTANAQMSLSGNATSIRTSAILTAADVLSTTFTVAQNVKAVDFYVSVTTGSLTGVVISPAGAKDGNPAAAGYAMNKTYQVTATWNGMYVIRVPRAELGAYQYAGCFVRGYGGAVDGSLCQISYKLDYGP